MIVMKFGGSSVGDAGRIERVATLVATTPEPPCVVLSAMADTTDELFAIAQLAEQGRLPTAIAALDDTFGRAADVAGELLDRPEDALAGLQRLRADVETLVRGVALLRERTARTTDAIVAHGERMSTALLTARLVERGVDAVEVDARRVMRTDARFGRAAPDRARIRELAAEHIAPRLAAGEVAVTQGYVGATADGATTTLGRGGSDWSAALLGAALGASEVQIWTDVEGVLTSDPRIVVDARPIATLSADEAAELAAFGAKVLHPSTIQPAVDAGIPVTVRHTLRPSGSFTRIEPKRSPSARLGVAALATRGPVTVLTMTSRRMLAASGYLAKLFGVFGELGVPVDLVATAEVSVACTVEADAPIDRLVAELDGLAHVEVLADCGIVAAIGDGLQRTPRVLERACRALHPIEPALVSFGGIARNLSFVVRRAEQEPALRRLHAEFFGAAATTGPDQRSEP